MAKIVKAVKKSVKSQKYKRTSEKVKVMGRSRTVYLRVKDGVKVIRMKGVYRKLSKMLKMDDGKVKRRVSKKSVAKSGGTAAEVQKRILGLLNGGDCGCASASPMSGGDAYGQVLSEEPHSKMYGGGDDAFPQLNMTSGGKRPLRRRRSSSKSPKKSSKKSPKKSSKKVLGLFGGALDAMGFPKLDLKGGDVEVPEMEGGKKVKKAVKKAVKKTVKKTVKKVKKVKGGEYEAPKHEGGEYEESKVEGGDIDGGAKKLEKNKSKELYAKAKKYGVKGRSKMRKPALVAAVRAAQKAIGERIRRRRSPKSGKSPKPSSL